MCNIGFMTLKDWRKLNGITQSELADKTGINQGFLSEIENKGTVSLPTAIALRDFTNGAVSVDDLLLQTRQIA